MKKITLTLMAALFVLNFSFAAVIYVDDDATGANDGSSWTNAYTDLQTAIDAANTGDEIWVAYGIYRPSKDKTGNAAPANARTKTFYLNKNIAIYGSFNGTEGSLAARVLPNVNPTTSTAADVTILSGDLNDNESDINLQGSAYVQSNMTQPDYPEKVISQDNAYSVVHVGTSAVALYLDGCVITAGSAFNYLGGTNEQINGGGVYNEGTPTIASCYFGGNFAYGSGGGVYSLNTITIAYCSLFGNLANVSGGAAYNYQSNSTFSATSFIGNTANGNGGGIYNEGGGSGAITCNLINAPFLTNQSAAGSGGAIYNNGTANSCVTAIVNCSFTGGNTPNGHAGVMYSEGSVLNNIYNSIFYSNTASVSTSNVFYNSGASATVIEHSLVQGTSITNQSTTTIPFTEGDGMIYNKNPQITSISPLTPDLTLKSNSPCINTGDNTILVSNGITTDAQGDNRFFCSTTDMGAFERSNGKGNIIRNNSIVLNGTTQYVNIGNTISNFNSAKSFTIEGWVKVIAYDGGATSETILTNRSGATGTNFCIAGTADAGNAGKLALRIGTAETVYSNSTIPAGEWTHVAVTFTYNGSNNNVVKLYINGNDDGLTFSTADNITTSSANTLIGYETDMTNY